MADIDDEAIRRLQDFIQSAVMRHWEETRTALQLTTLGNQIRGNPDTATVPHGGLKRFLETSSNVKVVEHPTVGGTVGAVPLSAPLPANLADLFVAKKQKPGGPNTGALRLAPTFWRAFHQPITQRRFVILSPDDNRFLGVRESVDDIEPEGKAVEILPEDINLAAADQLMTQKVAGNWDKIHRWLNRNHLPLSLFEIGSRPPMNEASERQAVASDITKALERLDRQDQARIFIPLDLVIRMLEGR